MNKTNQFRGANFARFLIVCVATVMLASVVVFSITGDYVNLDYIQEDGPLAYEVNTNGMGNRVSMVGLDDLGGGFGDYDAPLELEYYGGDVQSLAGDIPYYTNEAPFSVEDGETYTSYDFQQHSEGGHASIAPTDGSQSLGGEYVQYEYGYCHHGEWIRHYTYIPWAATDGYMSIRPFTPPIDFMTITSITQLQGAIDSIPTSGVNAGEWHIIRLDFSAAITPDTYTTTAGSTITISGNLRVILDSVINANNQVWYRNQTSGRHINVSSGAQLEVGNITLTRYEGWRLLNQTASSGGITVTSSSRLYMMHPDAVISNNRADRGGGVYVHQNSVFNMTNGAIINNVATSFGGGVGLDSVWSGRAFFNMSGGRVSGNRSYNSGGGIDMCCDNTVNISDDALVYGNVAYTYGGGISNAGTSIGGNFINISGGEIYNNIANQSGGGLHIGQSSPDVVTMIGGEIHNNIALNGLNTPTGGGGGIHIGATTGTIGGPFHLQGGIIRDNHTMGNGGGINFATGQFRSDQIDENTPVHITGNRAAGNGGGISLTSTTLQGVNNTPLAVDERLIISGNTAGNNGGGVYVGSTQRVVSVVPGGTISNNGHPTTVIADAQGANVNIETQNGGGIHVAMSAISMSGGQIYGNSATTYGGGIFLSNTGTTLTMTGGTIGGPVPQSGETSSYSNTAINGGGVWVGNNASFIMNTGTIGGETTHGTIIGNRANMVVAGDGGGGVHVTSGGTFTMHNGLITRNSTNNTGASSDGGAGVRLTGASTFIMHDGRITDNTAPHGAGVRVWGVTNYQEAQFTMNGGYIEGNHAIGLGLGGMGVGGGIHVQWGIVTMNNGNIRFNNSNHAGGIRIWGSAAGTNRSVFNMHGGYIIGNSALSLGGGVNVINATGEFNFHGGHIGTLGETSFGGNNVSNSNSASYGGGVWVGNGANFNIHGANNKYIRNNTADYDGGGVFVETTSYMAMQTGTDNFYITHNIADEMGGGIFTARHAYVNVLPLTGEYTNLILLNTVNFANNYAYAPYVPPSNANGLTNIAFGTLSIHNHPLNNYDINFRRPPVPFGFYKQNAAGNPVVGAIFQLYRVLPATGAWVPIGGPITSAGPNGWVGTWNISRGGSYRLVETFAPAPFQIPQGYWQIGINVPGDVVALPRGGNPPLWREGNNWYMANWPYPDAVFRFYKTDDADEPTEGDTIESEDAYFQLYRWNPLLDGGAGDWEMYPAPVFPATNTRVPSDSDGVVELTLPSNWRTPSTQFRLREVAPPGFVQPLGYWLISATFDYVLQQVNFTVTRVLDPAEGVGTHPIYTPEFEYLGGVSGVSLGIDLENGGIPITFEPSNIVYNATAPAPLGGGYIGIMPLTPVTSWAQLRALIAGGGTQNLVIDESFNSASGVPSNTAAIELPTNSIISITSSGAVPFTLTQTALNQRHFLVADGASLTLNNIILSGDNQSVSHSHGGVAVTGAGSSLTLNAGSMITSNRFNDGSPTGLWEWDNGGSGVRVTVSASLTMNSGSTIQNNITEQGNRHMLGGGVMLTAGTSFVMNGGIIQGNYAQTGAGVEIGGSGATFDMWGGYIQHNVATGNIPAPMHNPQGGGVRVISGPIFTMHGGVIQYNYAAAGSGSAGGGIHQNGGAGNPSTVNLLGGIVRRNRAAGIGGGLRMPESNIASMSGNFQMYENEAGTDGGGVHISNNAIFSMSDNARIDGNIADRDGGGVFTSGALTNSFTMTGGYITNNLAGRDGGGLFTTSHRYANPLVLGAGVYVNVNITAAGTFYGNRARASWYPPTIRNLDGTPAPGNQLPNVQWSGSPSSVNSSGYLYLLNNYDINFAPPQGTWFLGNRPMVPFRFHKTDARLQDQVAPGVTTCWDTVHTFLLPGAHFTMLRFNGPGSPPANQLVSGALIGTGAGQWTPVGTSISTAPPTLISNPMPPPMNIFINPLYTYFQLVETLAPSGFATPFGQWRGVLTGNQNDGFVFTVTTIGEAPDFVINTATGIRYVSNRVDFNLPLTGAVITRNVIFMTGGAVVFMATGVLAVYALYSKRKRNCLPA